MQLPGCVEDTIPDATVQPAVFDDSAYDTKPAPDPPAGDNVTGVPAGPESTVFETDSVAWVTAVNVNVTAALDAAA